MYHIYHRLTRVLVSKVRMHDGDTDILNQYDPAFYEVVIY